MKHFLFITFLFFALKAYGQDSFVIWNGTQSSTTYPIGDFNVNWTITQTIYPKSKIPIEGIIKSLSFQIEANRDFSISCFKMYLGSTNRESFNDNLGFYPIDSCTKVYEGNLNVDSKNYWQTLLLQTFYNYSNSKNLVLTIFTNCNKILQFHYFTGSITNTISTTNFISTNPIDINNFTVNYYRNSGFIPNIKIDGSFSTVPYLVAYPNEFDFDYKGGIRKVMVNSNQEEWSASSNHNWIQLNNDVANDSIIIKINENISFDNARSARVYVEGALTVDSIDIFQEKQYYFEKTDLLLPNTSSQFSIGDFDNDCDLDLLDNNLYINENHNYSINNSIELSVGSGKFCNLNNDNYLDIVGDDKIYINNNGSFILLEGQTLIATGKRIVADINSDGLEDLIVMGKTQIGDPCIKIYKNTGNLKFIEINHGIPGINGSLEIIDINKDNLLDVIICGVDWNGNWLNGIYYNTGYFSFKKGLPEFSDNYNAITYGDINEDGNIDLLLSGWIKSTIYLKSGDYNYQELNAEFPGFSGSGSFGDFDNDGDLDLFFSGHLYKLNGNFHLDSIPFIQNGNIISRLADFDNDRDLDLLYSGNGTGLNGSNESGGLLLYLNKTNALNSDPSIPMNCKATVIGGKAILSWHPSEDEESKSSGLTYNIYVGTSHNSFDIVNPNVTIIGENIYRKLQDNGNALNDTIYYLYDLKPGEYYFAVQAIDNGGHYSRFSEEVKFSVPDSFTKLTVPFFPVEGLGSNEFGDFDNDGDYDLLYSGNYYTQNMGYLDTVVLYVYQNSSFIKYPINFLNASLSWIDFNNDNNLDILANKSMYYNNNGSFQEVLEDYFFKNNPSNNSSSYGLKSIIDLDNDGDKDFICQDQFTSNRIYINDGDISNCKYIQLPNGGLELIDFDNDFDIDISVGNVLMVNWGKMKFEMKDIHTPLIQRWTSDLNNDGYLDLLFSGLDPQKNDKRITQLYYNISGNFVLDSINLFRAPFEDINFGDINNDGFVDILFGTKHYAPAYSGILFNYQPLFIEIIPDDFNCYRGNNTLCDLDHDQDLDIMIEADYFLNNGNWPNNPPSSPSSLSSSRSGYGILLGWDPSTDPQGGSGGLSYNVRIGTTPGGFDVMSPMSDPVSGYRRIPEMGNVQLNKGWRLDSLPEGKYYWSVQAIDQSFLGGPWAPEQTFTISVVRADFDALPVCVGASSSFTDKTLTSGTPVTSWLWEFGDGSTSTLQNPTHTYSSSGDFSVKLIALSSEYSDTIIKTVTVLPKPTAAFSWSVKCQGTSTPLTNTTSLNGLTVSSWSWDFGDDTYSSLENPVSHGYLNPGTYSVKLRALASNGCADSVTSNVIVAAYPVADITANAPLLFCSGDSVALSIAYNSGYSYNWLLNGTPITGGDSSRFAARLSGSYSVEVVNLVGNCKTTTSSRLVSSLPAPSAPVIVASGSSEFCSGDSVLLSVTSVPGLSYQWKLNGGAVGSNSSSLYAKNQGSYTVEVKNSTGCKVASVNSITTIVNSPPSVTAVSLSGSTEFCAGQSLLMSVAPASGYSYQWNNSSGPILGASSNSFSATIAGQYRLTITNTKGCSTSSPPITVTVKEVPSAPLIVAENYSPGKCSLDSPITLRVDQTVPGYSYKWKRNGTTISSASSSFISDYLSQGDYTVEANNNGCKSESAPKSIFFNNAPEKPLLYVQGPVVWYMASSNDSAAQYRWYLNDELINGADKYIYVANKTLGTYKVAIANQAGCITMSDPVTIPVSKGEMTKFDIPQKYTVGEDRDPFEDLRIYPNPTPGLFTIEMDNSIFGELDIRIFTNEGRQMLNIKFDKTTEHFATQVDLSGNPKGMYLVNLMMERFFASRKLIVE